MKDILLTAFAAAVADNVIFTRLLFDRPFTADPKKNGGVLAKGAAVTVFMTLLSVFTQLIGSFVLKPLGLEWLNTFFLIISAAGLALLFELAAKKFFPSFYADSGVNPLFLVFNCTVLGIGLINMQLGYGFFYSALFGFASGVGFTVALAVLSGIKERLRFTNPPKCLKGIPIYLVAAGLAALAFSGFHRLKF